MAAESAERADKLREAASSGLRFSKVSARLASLKLWRSGEKSPPAFAFSEAEGGQGTCDYPNSRYK